MWKARGGGRRPAGFLEPKFGDLDIDIKDLQKVFGRDGSTCQNPMPMQTPVTPPFSLTG